MRPQMTMNIRRVVRSAEDLAVVYNDWKLAAVDPNGREVTMAGKAIEVSRRQGDGSWLFAVDDPFARG
jgi:ketosteroid isomerase-like protein